MSVVFFDMDGVLIDSEGVYLDNFKAFLDDIGLYVEDKELFRMIGSNPKRDLELYKEWFEDKIDMDEFMHKKEQFHKKHPISFEDLLMKHAKEVLIILYNSGHHLSLVSSSSLRHIEKILDHFDIRKYFEYVISGENFKESKPNPEIYNYAKGKYANVDEDEMFVIEDSALGIEAAKRAGLRVIAKRDLRYSIDQSKADIIVDDLMDLLEIIS